MILGLKSTFTRLKPNGVPRGLAGSVHPFSFNRLDQLEALLLLTSWRL